MARILIHEMYTQNTLGDLAAATVQFIGYDRKGKAFAFKELTGKVGTPDSDRSGSYAFHLGDKTVYQVTAVIPHGVTCTWEKK